MRPVETWNERQGSVSPTLGKHSPKAVAGVLCVTAILYFAIQWKYASKIGPKNKIFSASRTADQADFAVMIDGLSKAAHRACNGGSLNTLLFDDSESALPYLGTKGDRLGGCMVIRETNVTPFSKAEMDAATSYLSVNMSHLTRIKTPRRHCVPITPGIQVRGSQWIVGCRTTDDSALLCIVIHALWRKTLNESERCLQD
jgi:hypothetical protein